MRRAVVPLLVLITGSLLGLNLVVVKIALRYSDPLTIQAMATAAGALVMLGTSAASGHRLVPRGRELLAALAVAGAMTVGSSLGLSFGVQRIDAGIAALVMSTTPIVTMVLSRIVLRERQSVLAIIGGILGVLGVSLISLSVGTRGGSEQVKGMLLLMIGALGWSLGLIFMKTLGHGVPARPLIGWQMTIGAPVLVVLALVSTKMAAEWTLWFVAAILYMGLLAKALTFLLQLATIRLGSPVQASLTAFLMPLFGTAGGVILLDETVTAAQLVGAGAILSGVALVLRSRARVQIDLAPPPA